MAAKDYSDDNKALRTKTAQLRALRLAKEALDLETAVVVPPKKPAVRKAPKARPHAPWPW